MANIHAAFEGYALMPKIVKNKKEMVYVPLA